MNINILILQILFLLQKVQKGKIVDRIDALKVYTQRYLKKDETFRSNCFIEMLITLPACGFNSIGINRKAQPFWDKLQSVPIEKAQQDFDVEVVPYEELWTVTMKDLLK